MKREYIYIILIIISVIALILGVIFVNKKGEEDMEDKPIVTMKVKDYGTITLELEPDIAPITVANFINLANNGFYDGLTFHRIIDGFMIQGGDKEGTGAGSATVNDLKKNGDISEYTIKGEFKTNGVTNNISHKAGVISMARAQSPNSASSQFFIVQEDSTFLDGQYAAFGKVISGMNVVDDIAKAEKLEEGEGSTPAKDIIIESVRVDTKGKTYDVPEIIVR